MTTHPVPVGTGTWQSPDLETTTDDRAALPRRTPGLLLAEIANSDWQWLVEQRPVLTPEQLSAWATWSDFERESFFQFVAGWAPGAVASYAAKMAERHQQRIALTGERFGQ